MISVERLWCCAWISTLLRSRTKPNGTGWRTSSGVGVGSPGAEADELVSLYQRASTHLSQLRGSPGANPGTVARLATLVARARSAVTGAQVPSWQVVARFISQDFPAAVYRAQAGGG